MRWILAIICVEALTEILIHSSLIDNLRRPLKKYWFFREVFSCGWCLSLWAAIFVSFIILLGFEIVLIPLAIHRIANIFHDCYSLLKKIRWRS